MDLILVHKGLMIGIIISLLQNVFEFGSCWGYRLVNSDDNFHPSVMIPVGIAGRSNHGFMGAREHSPPYPVDIPMIKVTIEIFSSVSLFILLLFSFGLFVAFFSCSVSRKDETRS